MDHLKPFLVALEIWQKLMDDNMQDSSHSDVLGWASSPEPAELSPFKPKPDLTLVKAYSGLGPGFRYLKPKPGAQARALIFDLYLGFRHGCEHLFHPPVTSTEHYSPRVGDR